MPTSRETPDSFTTYLRPLAQHPLLTRADEAALAQRYQQTRCAQAAHRLVTANLRIVLRVANEYRGYGASVEDLVQEGNLGLVVAIEKFDPARGFRFASYAVWWVRAYIHRYLMASWSLVKIGTTQAQRKLFFRLRSERQRLEQAMNTGEAPSDATLARIVGVKASDVGDMSQRMAKRDSSVDVPLVSGGTTSFIDQLHDPAPRADEVLEQRRQARALANAVAQAPMLLNAKERVVLRERLSGDTSRTLREVADGLQLSRERIRQIENNVVCKLRTHLQGVACRAMKATAS